MIKGHEMSWNTIQCNELELYTQHQHILINIYYDGLRFSMKELLCTHDESVIRVQSFRGDSFVHHAKIVWGVRLRLSCTPTKVQ